jgi:outer membrane immunogenic protein
MGTFKYLSVVAIATAISTAASAADLGAPAYGYKDGPVYGPSWSGFYFGVNGGYVWADPKFSDAPPPPAGPPRPHLDSGFAGGQIGYNLQFDNIVVGAVADISFTNMASNLPDGNYITDKWSMDRFGTVRAIGGYSLGRFLPYGTVGFGWADTSFHEHCADQIVVNPNLNSTCKNAGPRDTGDSQTLTGVVFGGGLKYAIDNHFSIGAEYLHFDFDAKSFNFGPFTNNPGGSAKIESSADVAKFTVDYKFSGGLDAPLK